MKRALSPGHKGRERTVTHEQMAEAVGATAATRAAALALEAVFANEEPMASEVATAQAAFAVACELARQTSVLGAIKEQLDKLDTNAVQA